MRLERLEISGFKSFSDRAELAFDGGVTAIVGPNGCGKSNVADAITWVLGEQSAKSLRGDRMEDVIFNGSDARKAGGTAEVRLRLSGLPIATRNGDGNGESDDRAIDDLVQAFTRDVEVTRRLYRSGESEYLIDGESCRLRDVHDLLMDTGLGAKAYAIIEQGKIGMILSSRPADRRQLIEEAAGITKYKFRRRAAELKLDAAQQNLTRIDDIVFEVEKQRGALKRQAARARRYKRLRGELRRWEKLLFARRYSELADRIETTRRRLADMRQREAVAAAHLAEVEADLGRLRLEQADADSRAVAVLQQAHGLELDINHRQQLVELHRREADILATRRQDVDQEIGELQMRREPARLEIESRAAAAAEVERARDEAAAVLAGASEAHGVAQQQIEAFESGVEAARGDVFAAINAITTIRHALKHATVQRERVAELLGKLEAEASDVFRERQRIDAQRSEAEDALLRARQTMDDLTQERTARESKLAAAKIAYESRVSMVRSREQELAGLEARLVSLEELDASRAGFGDAARMVLIQANGHVRQQGAVADYLETDDRYERAVEACLGELLQHVIVDYHEQAAAGLALIREHDAGRCGFVVVDPGSNGNHLRNMPRLPGVVPVSDVLRIFGPHVATLEKVLPEAYVAETFDQAIACARQTSAPVATLEGDVFHGPHLLAGGTKVESRGLLQAKREIKELRERVRVERESLACLANEAQGLGRDVAEGVSAVAALQIDQHRVEKEIVGHEALATRTADDLARLDRKSDVVALERRQAEEERSALDARCIEAQESLARLEADQHRAEERLAEAQRVLLHARVMVEELNRKAADAKAAHAGLVERSAGFAAEVVRLEDRAREIEERIAGCGRELQEIDARRAALLRAADDDMRTLDEGIRGLEELRERVSGAHAVAAALHQRVDAQDDVIRAARHELEIICTQAGELEIARASAESDLSHLAQSCIDAVQSSLDEVLAEIETLDRDGRAVPDSSLSAEPDADESEFEEAAHLETGLTGSQELGASEAGGRLEPPTVSASISAADAITALKAKIDRLGPVNMMAIEQFDELETRHEFLTTQRKDLIDSIAQTTEAIKRIDETTKVRFRDAFLAIQANFQETFSRLFGGGRTGLSLLDDNDPLESGIDIMASPPGKRLQSVQLLSGGEKALTAIALMFAIFRYKPSPFCVLDEIDAPLDDANVGRFVDMLQGMLDRTQFILITHNRRTMEIANRLYGVTMEEPGVSKLISVQLN